MSVVPYPFSQSDMTSASQVLRISSALPSVNIVKNGANLLTLQPIITLNTAGTYLISIKIDLTIIIGTTAITLINPTVDYGFFYYLTPINISTQPQPPVLDIFSGSKTLVPNIFNGYINLSSIPSINTTTSISTTTYVMCTTSVSPVNLYLNVAPYNLDIPSGATLSFTPTIEMVAPIQATINTINSNIASGTTYSNIVTIY